MLTRTMQECVIDRPGVLRWRECPSPQLLTGIDAIVRPLVVGRCDLDVAFVDGLLPIASGSALGHECIAEIVEIGDHVTGLTPGQRVIVAAQINCGTCRRCRQGFTGRCEAVPFGASFGMGRAGDYGGALADWMRVPFAAAMLVPLPARANPVEVIGVADMALDAWRAVAPELQARPGARVLVAGGKPAVIGLYAAGIAVALGAAEVVYWDGDPNRRDVARVMGARAIDLTEEPHGQFEIVVDACGDVAVLKRALLAAAPEAHFTSVTIYLGGDVAMPLRELYFKGITFKTGRPNVRPPMEHVLGLCQAGRFNPHSVAAAVLPFEQAEQAWISRELRTAVAR
jgi:threonine dehydrogenase-like Zn-dependent dehydrogenase